MLCLWNLFSSSKSVLTSVKGHSQCHCLVQLNNISCCFSCSTKQTCGYFNHMNTPPVSFPTLQREMGYILRYVLLPTSNAACHQTSCSLPISPFSIKPPLPSILIQANSSPLLSQSNKFGHSIGKEPRKYDEAGSLPISASAIFVPTLLQNFRPVKPFRSRRHCCSSRTGW